MPKKENGKNQKNRKRKLTALLSWEVEDLAEEPRSTKFLFFLYLILFSLSIYGLVTNNLLLSILVILFGFSYFLLEKKPSQTVIFAITKEGVFVHDHVYPYDSLESFWIEYEPEGIKELSIRTTRLFLPYLRVPIQEVKPAKLRKTLIKFIPEEKHKGGIGEIIDKF